jgi:Fungal specific transcription factor domain
MAVYNNPSTNVFLQLQNEPIPSTAEDDETYELPLIQAIGAPDDTPLYNVDSPYLHFFVLEFPSILSVDHLFPSALGRILGMTIGNPALWHSVLALSSFLTDKIVGRPASRTYIHLHHSLPLIQSAIQHNTMNDSHIAAVFFLAYLNLASGEIASAGRHLDGLILMLERRGATVPEDDPLINAIRRLTIRLDNVRGMTGRNLGFPTNKLEMGVSHHEWLMKLMLPDKLNTIDWAIAEFELEDLANQLIHLHLRARALRSSPTHNPETDEHELLFRAEVLKNELRRWRLRPILLAAEADENLLRLVGLGQTSTPAFLDYPPLQFKNMVYASLLIMYYRLEILGSLVIRPELGPEPPQRLEAAVNLCRTFASYKAIRQKVPSLMVLPLALAGFVLGETSHPQGIVFFILC